MRETALYRLFTFHLQNLTSIFLSLVRLSNESAKVRVPLWRFVTIQALKLTTRTSSPSMNIAHSLSYIYPIIRVDRPVCVRASAFARARVCVQRTRTEDVSQERISSLYSRRSSYKYFTTYSGSSIRNVYQYTFSPTLALQPSFGPRPTSMKLSVSLWFTRS
jgi:hypothetical protein